MEKPQKGTAVLRGLYADAVCDVRAGLTSFGGAARTSLAQNGFTNTQTSLITTIRSAAYLLGTFAIGRYYRARLSHRLRAGGDAGLRQLPAVAAAKSSRLLFCRAVAGVSYALGSMVLASILMRAGSGRIRAGPSGSGLPGTGLATIVFSPLFTAIAESGGGVDRAFLWTAAFCAAAAVLVFFLIRSDPAALGLEPWGKAAPESTQERALHALHPSRLRWALLLLAVLLVSGIGATGFTHLMTLYMSEGMDAMRTAAAFSLCGLALMAGKCVCGALCDKLGSYRANYLLFGSFILGCTLCVLAPLKSEALMLASAVFLGFGGSLITVGVSIWAGDLSTPERYEKTLRLFQGAYGLGGIVLSFLPGAIADLAGGYAPAYAVFAVMLLYSLFMLQSTYRLAKV